MEVMLMAFTTFGQVSAQKARNIAINSIVPLGSNECKWAFRALCWAAA